MFAEIPLVSPIPSPLTPSPRSEHFNLAYHDSIIDMSASIVADSDAAKPPKKKRKKSKKSKDKDRSRPSHSPDVVVAGGSGDADGAAGNGRCLTVCCLFSLVAGVDY